ncbi:replication initiator [Streptomyces sp. NPDC059010]|uniref:replication initiator n=1 Tax=Streptomyces sp. NPDC059010 TaxID=3346695 RepID=UPI0036A96959
MGGVAPDGRRACSGADGASPLTPNTPHRERATVASRPSGARRCQVRLPLSAPPPTPATTRHPWEATGAYRGHILTKSRAYSTTYAALRAERGDHVGHSDIPDAVAERHWRYVGSGHTPGAALLAAGVAEDLARLREVLREERSAIPGEADR